MNRLHDPTPAEIRSLFWTNPATEGLNEIRGAPIVRFSLPALSPIFFLVDPLASIGSLLAIPAGPGAISPVMVLVGQAPSLWHGEMGAIPGSIALTAREVESNEVQSVLLHPSRKKQRRGEGGAPGVRAGGGV